MLGGLASVGVVVLVALRRRAGHGRLVAVVTAAARRIGRQPPEGMSVTLEQIGGALADSRHLWCSVAWSVASWLTDMAAVWLVFAAFGHPLDLTILVVGYATINLLNSVPELTPGWIGVFEASMAAVFTGLGVPADVALAGVLVYRLVSFWLPVAAGIAPAVLSVSILRRHEAAAGTVEPGLVSA
ncbi:MAG TPA: flippase-like domain-containing protein [Euzebya sp.]|nr:flippase-like domain-containing protein [Euzebya sp.]